ncbi:hypothetical protein ACUN9V_16400 [Salinicola sp. V024]|uniref:hypothetical protein n=1 Tax=Salinicola TaxID=404432 RepID=UPI00094E517D|nr:MULTISPECIES: hypothetical protein [Salinicola]OLO09687.1 hypothetical protein BTW08_00965 [Salinicola sp. MH3R3-1]
MHKHVEWDTPGGASVDAHYAKDEQHRATPQPGTMLTARYHGSTVRVKVEAYKDGVSIGKVAALVGDDGDRHDTHGELSVGDMVRLPDDKRAFQASAADDD